MALWLSDDRGRTLSHEEAVEKANAARRRKGLGPLPDKSPFLEAKHGG